MKRMGVTHPVPTEYVKRIYKNGKTVFVSKTCLCKVYPGDKFIIYESKGAMAYIGWADILSIGRQRTGAIRRKYGDKLILTGKELRDYANGYQEMNVIEYENFVKFDEPVKPKRFVSLSGKYIYEDEFEMIKKNIFKE